MIAAALSEAMSLAVGANRTLRTLEIEYLGAAPVGAFLELEGRVGDAVGETVQASAGASVEGRPVARARGAYA